MSQCPFNLRASQIAKSMAGVLERLGLRLGPSTIRLYIRTLNLVTLGLLCYWASLQIGGGIHFQDAEVMWAVDIGHPYDANAIPGYTWSFFYSPAIAQVFDPFSLIPFWLFRIFWLAAGLGALVWMVGPMLGLLLVGLPINVGKELSEGNIHIFIALAVWLGFRYPSAWAFPLLTKVTPGVGLAWHAFRRQWRSLFVGLGATSAIVAISFATVPQLWFEWAGWLLAGPDIPSHVDAIVVGWLPLRLFVAIAIVAIAARRDWPWLVPAAVWISMPIIWITSQTVLVAIWPIWRDRMTSRCMETVGDVA